MDQNFYPVFQQCEELLKQYSQRDQLLQAIAELLKDSVYHYDWVGFYILAPQSDMLVLGPYKGAPTEHTHIPVGKGICGQVAASGKTMVVQDVTEQENYLACSMDVQSEIVVPILKNGVFVAEIDIDSHAYAPFTQEDERFLSALAEILADRF